MRRSDFPRLKGFRDFPPEALARRSRIFEAWRAVARRHGFLEYDGPPLESLDLYVEKSGPEIVGQLYTFQDKGGRPVALRPEMTPSLARILAARSRALPKPIRWFSIPQLFRYERQQRGRLREHFQWNVDIVGEAGTGADAEVIAVAVEGLCELGLTASDFRVRISHRELLAAVLGAVGVGPESAAAALGIIDKLGRRAREHTLSELAGLDGLGVDGAEELLSLLTAPDAPAALRAYLADRPRQAAHRRRAEGALLELENCLGRLEALGLADFLAVDLSIVRGLDYYTGIVFELFDLKGELRAICGGGRYDELLGFVGGEALPATGFGMGDVVLGEMLTESGLARQEPPGVDVALVAVPESIEASEAEAGGGDRWEPSRNAVLGLASDLRRLGVGVSYALADLPPAKQMRAAQRAGARIAISIGPAELKGGAVRVRDLATGSEGSVPRDEVADLVAHGALGAIFDRS